MISYLVKVGLTAMFIVAMSELAKRSLYLAALLFALPLATVIATIWLFLDTHDAHRAADYSYGVLLLTPPGMLFLFLLPLGVRFGINFWISLAIAALITGAVYFAYAWALKYVWGISL
ncbi:MAG TPA: DUF3147 family protein [Rhizomicrobium sp.]|nr:DUF3147 family protein [Rhizomicrobium sp.]